MTALPSIAARATALVALVTSCLLGAPSAAAGPPGLTAKAATPASYGIRVRCELDTLAGFALAHLRLENVVREAVPFEYTVVLRSGERVWRSPTIAGRLARGDLTSRTFRPFAQGETIDACEVTGHPDPRATIPQPPPTPPKPPVPVLSDELAPRRAELRFTALSVNVLGFLPIGGRADLRARVGLGRRAELFAGVSGGGHHTLGNVENVVGWANPRLGLRAFAPLVDGPRGSAVLAASLPVWINPRVDRFVGSYEGGNFTVLDPRDYSTARLLVVPQLDVAWRASTWFIQAGVSQAVAIGGDGRARDATTLSAGIGFGGDTAMAVEYRLQAWPDGRRLHALAFAFGGREPQTSPWRLLVQPLLTSRMPVLGIGFDVANRW